MEKKQKSFSQDHEFHFVYVDLPRWDTTFYATHTHTHEHTQQCLSFSSLLLTCFFFVLSTWSRFIGTAHILWSKRYVRFYGFTWTRTVCSWCDHTLLYADSFSFCLCLSCAQAMLSISLNSAKSVRCSSRSKRNSIFRLQPNAKNSQKNIFFQRFFSTAIFLNDFFSDFCSSAISFVLIHLIDKTHRIPDNAYYCCIAEINRNFISFAQIRFRSSFVQRNVFMPKTKIKRIIVVQ